ncbi:MAG: hypothetical protein V1701_10495 [Planctomycetota bacterium]
MPSTRRYKEDNLEDKGRLQHIISGNEAADDLFRRLSILAQPLIILVVYVATGHNKSLTALTLKCSRKTVQRTLDKLVKESHVDLSSLPKLTVKGAQPSLPSPTQSIKFVYDHLKQFRPSVLGDPKAIGLTGDELSIVLKGIMNFANLYVLGINKSDKDSN